MRVCKYLNQRVRLRSIFQGCFKNKKEKETHEEIEFLLPFTGCTKVLVKMPGRSLTGCQTRLCTTLTDSS